MTLRSYREVEFVCHNSDYPHSTSLSAQGQLYEALCALEGVLPYRQDFSDPWARQVSLAAVLLDDGMEAQVRDAARRCHVEVDLVQAVSAEFVQEILAGMLPYRSNADHPSDWITT